MTAPTPKRKRKSVKTWKSEAPATLKADSIIHTTEHTAVPIVHNIKAFTNQMLWIRESLVDEPEFREAFDDALDFIGFFEAEFLNGRLTISDSASPVIRTSVMLQSWKDGGSDGYRQLVGESIGSL
jgi:hypothetical protein